MSLESLLAGLLGKLLPKLIEFLKSEAFLDLIAKIVVALEKLLRDLTTE